MLSGTHLSFVTKFSTPNWTESARLTQSSYKSIDVSRDTYWIPHNPLLPPVSSQIQTPDSHLYTSYTYLSAYRTISLPKMGSTLLKAQTNMSETGETARTPQHRLQTYWYDAITNSFHRKGASTISAYNDQRPRQTIVQEHEVKPQTSSKINKQEAKTSRTQLPATELKPKNPDLDSSNLRINPPKFTPNPQQSSPEMLTPT